MPSGEYDGWASAAGLEAVRFVSSPPSAGTVQMSVFVDQAWSLMGSEVKASSLPSGDQAYSLEPPNGPGGVFTSSLDVRSRAAPVVASATNRWLFFPSFQAFQWRIMRWSKVRTLLLAASFSLSFAAVCSGVVPG